MARSGQVLNIAVAICLATVLAALWCSAVAAAVRTSLELHPGGVLAFLPGVSEIWAVGAALGVKGSR